MNRAYIKYHEPPMNTNKRELFVPIGVRSRLDITRNTGFTLIELLVVIAIIMIVAAISIAAVTPFFKGSRLRSSARTVQAIMVRARSYAINRRRRYTVEFDVVNNKVNVRDRTGQLVGKTLSLPAHVQFQRDNNNNPIVIPTITFYPNGTATQQGGFNIADIIIEDVTNKDSGGAEQMTLRVNGFTGQVRRITQ